MLVGRKKEQRRLEKAHKSANAEFIVLYGRRRVGKTFLIKQFFSNKKCKFLKVTGLKNGTLKKQLGKFSEGFSETFLGGIEIRPQSSWAEAFKLLNKAIDENKTREKTVIFLDELPWLATSKSGLLQEIDYYWNHYWSNNRNVILIVCGSSASWLIKNIIYNTGGLHNRCTGEIKLEPFDLQETNEFLLSNKIQLNKEHILDLYMALGGIPYYLSYVEPKLSAAENIQKIMFAHNAPLKDEFQKLFTSLFKYSEVYIEIIRIIASKKDGITRADLIKLSVLSNKGGRLSTRLQQLEQTNFISRNVSMDKERGEYFKVIDEFCLFYLHWVDKNINKAKISNYWMQQIQKPQYEVWSGYSFEAVCFKHIEQIIRALHLINAENVSTWREYGKNKVIGGAQIDMIIERADDAITLCEIKYTSSPFTITKQYAQSIRNKIEIFKQSTKTKKQVFMALISANGVKANQYLNELISGVVKLEDLFK